MDNMAGWRTTASLYCSKSKAVADGDHELHAALSPTLPGGSFGMQDCLNLCLLISVCYLKERKDMGVGNPGLNM